MKNKGWPGEKQRHSMSSRGVKTKKEQYQQQYNKQDDKIRKLENKIESILRQREEYIDMDDSWYVLSVIQNREITLEDLDLLQEMYDTRRHLLGSVRTAEFTEKKSRGVSKEYQAIQDNILDVFEHTSGQSGKIDGMKFYINYYDYEGDQVEPITHHVWELTVNNKQFRIMASERDDEESVVFEPISFSIKELKGGGM